MTGRSRSGQTKTGGQLGHADWLRPARNAILVLGPVSGLTRLDVSPSRGKQALTCNKSTVTRDCAGDAPRMTRPHLPTVAGAAQDWSAPLRIENAANMGQLHLISRFTLAALARLGTSEQVRLYTYPFAQSLQRSHKYQPNDAK